MKKSYHHHEILPDHDTMQGFNRFERRVESTITYPCDICECNYEEDKLRTMSFSKSVIKSICENCILKIKNIGK